MGVPSEKISNEIREMNLAIERLAELGVSVAQVRALFENQLGALLDMNAFGPADEIRD